MVPFTAPEDAGIRLAVVVGVIVIVVMTPLIVVGRTATVPPPTGPLVVVYPLGIIEHIPREDVAQ
jgi:hypothetical protein